MALDQSPESMCVGKMRHPNREDARRHANGLRTKEDGKHYRFNVYRCPFCFGFHVGHTSRYVLRRTSRKGKQRARSFASAA